MSAVDDSALPPAHKARAAFIDAMDNWDAAAADVAITALARTTGANEIYELFFRYGMRDYRSIGHKAIYVANSYRTLGCIGWQHAEPVLRSRAYALVMHEGSNPAKRDDEADRPFRRNEELVGKIGDKWRNGKLDESGTKEMLETFRSGSNDDASDAVVEVLQSGVAPQSVWDALHVCAGEMLMQQPGIVPLHAVTTTNALHFAYQVAQDDNTRRLLLLQNAAFLPMFRKSMGARGKVRDLTIDALENGKDATQSATTPSEILSQLGNNPMSAARGLLAMLQNSQEKSAARQFMDEARVLVFLKGDNAHDYKFSSAVLEDYFHVSPRWRDTYLASNIFQMRAAGAPDNKLVERTRMALA